MSKMGPFLHIKTNKTYEVVGRATNATNGSEDQIMILYKRHGKTFCREINEFRKKFHPPIK